MGWLTWGLIPVGAWNVGLIEQAFADAAVDPSRWNAAMEVVSDVTQGAGTILLPLGDAQGPSRLTFVPHSLSMVASLENYVCGGWAQRDERFRAWPIIKRTRVVSDLDFTSPNAMARHPYYQEFLAPHGLQWFAGVLVSAGDQHWCLSIQRSIKQGPFSSQELKQLAKLSHCLGSAAALARAVGFSAANAALEAYELSGTAVVMINRLGEVIRLNGQAENLLGHGVRVRKKRLVSDHPDATEALDRALHELICANRDSSLMPPVRLPRTGRLPLLVYPLKLSPMAANVFAECQALLVLIDPEKRNRPPEAVLKSAFGFTAAEARLASRLATGEAIETASDALGIAKDTARNQLKSIFAKTATHRQAELVATIASLLGQLFLGA